VVATEYTVVELASSGISC